MPDQIPNQGAAPVDLSTPVGQVRLLIGDTDPTPGTEQALDGTGTYTFFSDAEITAYLAMLGTPRKAAAQILRAIAASTALKLKKWSSADLMVDGPAIATALLKAADALDTGDAAALAVESQAFAAVVQVGGRSRSADKVRDDEDFLFRGRYVAYPEYAIDPLWRDGLL